MNRFLLKFDHEETERQYSRWIVEHGFKRADSEFLCMMVVICGLVSVQNFLIAGTWITGISVGLEAAYVAWEVMIRRKMRVEELSAKRTRMVLRTRIILQVLNCLSTRFHTAYSIKSMGGLFTHNGTIMSLLLSYCLRLKFQHHFPYQIITSSLMLFASVKGPCAELMGQPVPSLMTHIVQVFERGSKSIESGLYGWLGMEPDEGPALMCPCIHAMSWIHVFVHGLVGCYFFWVLELRSRRAFVGTLSEGERKARGLQEVVHSEAGCIDWMDVFEGIVVFTLSWELNFFLVKAIDAWGI